jgi:hypothetical protein
MQQVTLPFIQTPQRVYDHYRETGRCLACHHQIKHEIHLYNHWKKHHVVAQPVSAAAQRLIEPQPRYWVWFQDTWVPVQMHVALAAMIHKRCVAVEKETHARANS